ncbi:MAG: type II CAAX endopeptidase family protein [Pseudomonadota bacterium]
MSTLPLPHAPSSSRSARLLTQPLVRLLIGALAVAVPVILTMVLAQQIPDKSLRQLWPSLLAAALCVTGYAWYVRKVERRAVDELSAAGAGRELGIGVATGAGLSLLVLGALYAAGSFEITGQAPLAVVLKPLTAMVMVALFEELLFRGVLFRVAEKSLGSLLALALSGIVFAATHAPNANSTLLTAAITLFAGVMFGAAYMTTRRLWLAIGIHFAWNFTSDGVFSLPTSGNAANGLLQGRLSGPDWLSGGAYGIEGSVVTMVVIGAAAAGLLLVAVRRGHWVMPKWRRAAA